MQRPVRGDTQNSCVHTRASEKHERVPWRLAHCSSRLGAGPARRLKLELCGALRRHEAAGVARKCRSCATVQLDHCSARSGCAACFRSLMIILEQGDVGLVRNSSEPVMFILNQG